MAMPLQAYSVGLQEQMFSSMKYPIMESYLTLTKFSSQKHSIGNHFLLPSTLAFLSFIQAKGVVEGSNKKGKDIAR
ncbi:Putative zinc metalloprotease TRE2 [Gossypium arboreum]|uniref:Putative zinc metalloprotease TRE2 n=1 Tax=Gossypium arboreum TaxID=29729 RepID=A0A0B0NKS0_GOSAR|nr:Putative zinc metalloprotease TRE2 [Gossypium arboreum]